MPETFTQTDLDAAVAAAVGPLQQRLTELEAQAQDSEVGRAVAAAVAEKDTQISDLQSQLDTAVAARTAAEAKMTETETFWAEAIAAHEEAIAFEARRNERVSKAAEIGVFNDDYIAANADRFAAMSDEDFAARLEEWRLIAADKAPSGIPAKTAFTASRVEQPQTSTGSRLGQLAALRANRVDPRTLGGVG